MDEEDVIHLLRVAIEKDGSQAAWARRRRIERPSVNAMLAGRIPVSKTVADALLGCDECTRRNDVELHVPFMFDEHGLMLVYVC